MPTDTLSVLSEKILLAVWKLNGVGAKSVTEDALRSELSDSSDGFSKELKTLDDLGFIVRRNGNGQTEVGLTPLGVAILRQIEEDKLQELR